MDHLGLPYGVIEGLHPNDLNQKRTAGFAVTIQQRPKCPWASGKGKTKQRMVINTMLTQGDVLVIDAMGRMDVCTGGGLLALRAKMVGAKGFVIDGCLRDAADIRNIGFPAYLKGTAPRASGDELETSGINEPITVGGARVEPGDLLVMDDTGCIVIPPKELPAILKAAEIIVKQEKRAEELLLQGMEFESARKMGVDENPWDD